MNAGEARKLSNKNGIRLRQQEIDNIIECIKQKTEIGEGSVIYECNFRLDTKEHFDSLGYTTAQFGQYDLAIYW